jgi:hypothetical protein
MDWDSAPAYTHAIADRLGDSPQSLYHHGDAGSAARPALYRLSAQWAGDNGCWRLFGFSVAAPVTWRQIEHGLGSDAFSISKPPRAIGLRSRSGSRAGCR